MYLHGGYQAWHWWYCLKRPDHHWHCCLIRDRQVQKQTANMIFRVHTFPLSRSTMTPLHQHKKALLWSMRQMPLCQLLQCLYQVLSTPNMPQATQFSNSMVWPPTDLLLQSKTNFSLDSEDPPPLRTVAWVLPATCGSLNGFSFCHNYKNKQTRIVFFIARSCQIWT